MKPSMISGLQGKLLMMVMLPALVIAVGLTTYSTYTRFNDVEALQQEKAQAIARQISIENVNYIFTGNTGQLQRNLQRHFDQYHSLYRVKISTTGDVYELQNKPVGETDSVYALSNMEIIPAESDLSDFALDEETDTLKSLNLGTTEIWLLDETDEDKQLIVQTAFILLTMIFFVSLLIVFPVSRRLTAPIRELATAFEKLGDGNYQTRVGEYASDEVKTLQAGFNEMSEALQNQHERLNEEVAQVSEDLNTTLQAMEIQNVELDIARKQAVESNRVKSEFLANMSHEIRTPMNGIVGFTSLLNKTTLDDTQQNYVTTIKNSASSLLHILNDILDFSKLEAGKITSVKQNFIIEDVISEVIEIMSPLAHEKSLTLIPLLFNDVPHQVFGDRQHLIQILSNLVSNAIKFTAEGEVILRVSVEEDNDDNCVVKFSITDTGIGISVRDQQQLFQPFKQVSSDYNRGFGGTGLGLSICKSLVGLMHGELSLESEPGKGSTFNVTLPFIVPEVIPSESDQNLDIFNGHQLLLYDKHRLSRLSLNNTLQNLGFEVLINEQPVCEPMANQPGSFDMCILSLTNDELAQYLGDQELQLSCDNPVFVLLPTSDKSIMETFSKRFDCPVISKPVLRSQLIKPLKRALQLHQKPTSSAKTAELSPLKVLADKNILIVDDNNINQDLLASLLKDTGAELRSAHDGQMALEAASQQNFDLVFMDIHMPVMNGIDATRKLRESGFDQPIIGLTADIAFKDSKVPLELGFSGMLIKPLDMDDLARIIQSFATAEGIILSSAPEPSVDRKANKVKDSQELPVRNLDQALRIAAGQENVAERLLRELVKQLPHFIETAQRELEKRDWQKLWDIVHKLHGATSVCGVPALHTAVKNIQQSISTKDYLTSSQQLANIEIEAQRLMDMQGARTGSDASLSEPPHPAP